MVTQASRPRGGQPVLDADKQRTVVALMSIGFSRRMAASYLGCAPSTIARTAQRDPAFGLQVAQASQNMQLVALKTLMRVAAQDKYWRASAWICERLSSHQFGLRRPRQYTGEQVCTIFGQVKGLLAEHVPEENWRKAGEKMAEILTQLEADELPIRLDDFMPEAEPEPEPEPEPVDTPPGPSAEVAPPPGPSDAASRAAEPESEPSPPAAEKRVPEPDATVAVESAPPAAADRVPEPPMPTAAPPEPPRVATPAAAPSPATEAPSSAAVPSLKPAQPGAEPAASAPSSPHPATARSPGVP